MLIGIDIGGSATKVAGWRQGAVTGPLSVKSSDSESSGYGAFGKYLHSNCLKLSDIEKVMVTGIGSAGFPDDLYGVPVEKTDEFAAIGRGGLFLSGLSKAIVVSMGTGTALVKADGGAGSHIGGSGVGGGTLLGLSGAMLGIHDFDEFVAVSMDGNLDNVDLTIGDMTSRAPKGLPPETTAANFGKLRDLASKGDMALGIVNLVFQTIGTIAVFAARGHGIGDIILTGSLTRVPQAEGMFRTLSEFFGVNFHIPVNAEYACAIGALPV